MLFLSFGLKRLRNVEVVSCIILKGGIFIQPVT